MIPLLRIPLLFFGESTESIPDRLRKGHTQTCEGYSLQMRPLVQVGILHCRKKKLWIESRAEKGGDVSSEKQILDFFILFSYGGGSGSETSASATISFKTWVIDLPCRLAAE